VYGFWAFLQERLNHVLKSFKTNNHSGGELEVTLMRSFESSNALRNLVRRVSPSPEVLAHGENTPQLDYLASLEAFDNEEKLAIKTITQ
jgi:hypothetical protein